MSRARKDLSDEDRILWSLVAQSTTPLRPARPKPAPVKEPAKPVAKVKPVEKSTEATRPPLPAYVAPVSVPAPPRGHIDRQTTDKLAKGRLALEARIDLHGMRQDEAYSLLLSFVMRAHDRGVRYVLVITGKGPGGDGVLRRSVPQWLATAPFRLYVSGLDQAARGHGGAGALYVRVKRPKAVS